MCYSCINVKYIIVVCVCVWQHIFCGMGKFCVTAAALEHQTKKKMKKNRHTHRHTHIPIYISNIWLEDSAGVEWSQRGKCET